MLYILYIICIVSSLELLQWSYVLFNNSYIISLLEKDDRRININKSTLYKTSLFIFLVTLCSWCYELLLIFSNNLNEHTISILLLTLFQLIIICLLGFIASYIKVGFNNLTFISKKVLIFLNKYVYKNNLKKLFTNGSLDYKEKIPLLLNFLNEVSFFLWVKDKNNKFLYVNDNICKDLLLLNYKNVVGKTSAEIAKFHRNNNIVYTFGEMCCDSDNVTKENLKTTSFYESGLVNNKFLALKVIKSPIFDNNKLIGTIGFAIDITTYNKMYEDIEYLIKKKEFEKAASIFLAYKRKYDSSSFWADYKLKK